MNSFATAGFLALVSLSMLPGAADAQGSAPAAPSTADAASANDYGIQEIVVTAERRSQKIMDVPTSIQAFSGENLKAAGITDVSGIAQLTPGLTFSRSSQNTPVYTLRGLGFNTPSLTSTSPVGLYVDEVAYAFPYMSAGPLFDVERVEILKGPQGTLYGRNTTGGLINFITNKPTDKFEASATAEIGNYETHNIEGYLSGPIADAVSVRLAGRLEKSSEGWQHSISRSDTLGRKDNGAMRLIVAWEPNGPLSGSFTASYWYNKSDTEAAQAALYSPQTPAFAIPGLAKAIPAQWSSTTADWDPQTAGQPPLRTNSNFYGVAARLNYRLSDHATITSLTGYNHLNRDDNNDVDGTQFDVFSVHSFGNIGSLSQELRLVGDVDQLKYIAGVYYSRDIFTEDSIGLYDGSSTNHLLRFLAQNVIDPTNQRYSAAQYADGFANYRDLMNGRSTSESVFFNLEYALSDEVKLISGARYTADSLHYGSCSADYNGNTLPIWNTSVEFIVGLATHTTPTFDVAPNQCMTFNENFTAPSQYERPALNQNNVSGRETIEYTPQKDVLVYGTVSRGFKSGAAPVLNANVVSQLTAAVQEEVLAYEIGSKMSLFSNHVEITGALFHDDYKNKQLYGSVADPVFTTLTRLVNIPKSKVDGGELEASWRVTKELNISLGAAYTKSEVTEYLGVNRFAVATNFEGSKFPYTPEWQNTAAIAYNRPISNNYLLSFNINANRHTSSIGTLGNDKGFNLTGYTLTNADLGVTSPDGRWRADVFGRNIFNTYYWTATDVFTDTVIRVPGMAATYGGSVTFKF